MHQRVVVAKQQLKEKDAQLAKLQTTLHAANERICSVQEEFDIYLENQTQLGSAGSSDASLKK